MRRFATCRAAEFERPTTSVRGRALRATAARRPVRAAGTNVRPLCAAALARPGRPLAELPRRAHPQRRATPCSTSPRAPARSRSSSYAGRVAAWWASTRAWRCSRWRASESRPRSSSSTATPITFLRGRVVRRAHVHVPPPLRRRSAATLAELARVVRPGGTVAGLEFGVPENPIARAAWEAYVRIGLPVAGRLVSPGWAEVGGFLADGVTTSGRPGPGAAPRSLA